MSYGVNGNPIKNRCLAQNIDLRGKQEKYATVYCSSVQFLHSSKVFYLLVGEAYLLNLSPVLLFNSFCPRCMEDKVKKKTN